MTPEHYFWILKTSCSIYYKCMVWFSLIILNVPCPALDFWKPMIFMCVSILSVTARGKLKSTLKICDGVFLKCLQMLLCSHIEFKLHNIFGVQYFTVSYIFWDIISRHSARKILITKKGFWKMKTSTIN